MSQNEEMFQMSMIVPLGIKPISLKSQIINKLNDKIDKLTMERDRIIELTEEEVIQEEMEKDERQVQKKLSKKLSVKEPKDKQAKDEEKRQKISRNQKLLFEEFLKERKRHHIQDEETWERKKRFFKFEEEEFTPLNRCLMTILKLICGLDNPGITKLFGDSGIRERDNGRLFFEWSKEKCKELKIPVSTFSSLKQTREVAEWLIGEWGKKFNNVEEVIAWFDEEEFCLK